jgi:hypothetical protein
MSEADKGKETSAISSNSTSRNVVESVDESVVTVTSAARAVTGIAVVSSTWFSISLAASKGIGAASSRLAKMALT